MGTKVEDARITRNGIVRELIRSPHGKLEEYTQATLAAAQTDPEFLSHLIAWNEIKGEVRDSKVALPVIALTALTDDELADNASAHIALLGPRELSRALAFAKALKARSSVWTKRLRPALVGYLRAREANYAWWERVALQHRNVLKQLYAQWNVRPNNIAQAVLFDRKMPAGSVFADVRDLSKMDASRAAEIITTRRIPYLVAVGAMGTKAKSPEFLTALVASMSPAELLNNSKQLEKLGATKLEAYTKALERAAKAPKGRAASLKAGRAAEAVETVEVREKLQQVQETRVKAMSIDGRWLVLGDKSGSMSSAINAAVEIAGVLAAVAKESVQLVFFDNVPTAKDVTGKTLEEIRNMTRNIRADGGTSIGCGLQWAFDRGHEVDGIAIVTDGGENGAPYFTDVYKAYARRFGKEPTVYLYLTMGQDGNSFLASCQRERIDVQMFDLRRAPDSYSLPNLVQTMRTNRYSLADEIMEVPLRRLAEVLKGREVQP